MDNFINMINLDQVLVLLTVIGIDLALSADNAVVIGMAAATLPAAKRTKVIAIGTLCAALLRVILSVLAVKLLSVVGLVLAGGILLLYVAWKLWWDLKGHAHANAERAKHLHLDDWTAGHFRQAIFRIVLADLSMSLENILGVAGVARHHMSIMIFGLVLSVLLTGIAASIISRLIDRHRWIGYLGVALIIWVSLSMIWDGMRDVLTHLGISMQTLLS